MNKTENSPKGYLSLLLMITITIVTQIFTLMKTSMVAGYFGTSVEMDAYNFANSIVTFIFGFIAAGISTVIIPQYVKNRNRRSTDSFITLIYLCLATIVILVILFRSVLIGSLTNKDIYFVQTSGYILILLLISNFFLSISDITVAYFQCIKKYNVPKIINLVSQILVIGVLYYFNVNLSIYDYALIISVGLFINFLIDTIVAFKEGWRYKPSFDLSNNDTQNIIKQFMPVVFSTGVYRLSLMVDSIIANRLETGMITILSYSNMIAGMVSTVLLGNLLNYCYPKIVLKIKEKNNQDFFWKDLNIFHFIMCLVIAGYICVGDEGIRLLFMHGKFSVDASLMVYLGGAIYIFGQQFDVIRDLMYRYFYAKGDTKTAAYNSLVVSVVNISISVLLVSVIGFYGIIIGTILASVVSLTIILIIFNKKIGYDVAPIKIVGMLVSNEVLMIVTIVFVFVSKRVLNINNDLVSILVYGIETVIVYLLLAIAFRRNTLKSIREI